MTSDLVHPVVRRLESAVIVHLPVSVRTDKRFKQIITSLALCVAVLWDAMLPRRGGDAEKGKWEACFVEALTYLRTVGAEKDKDLVFVKWYTAYLYQQGVGDVRSDTSTNHQRLPRPDSLVGVRKSLFSGVIHRKLKQVVQRAKARSPKCLAILSTFLQGKDVWPALSRESMQDTLKGHMVGLGTQAPSIAGDIYSTIIDVIDEFVTPIVGTKLSFSDHASFMTSREKGGGGAEVLKNSVPYVFPEGGAAEVSIFDIRRTRYAGRSIMFGEVEAKLFYPDQTEVVKIGTKSVVYEPTLRDFATSFADWKQKVWRKLKLACWDRDEPDVKVQVITEAGKFRPITLGDAVSYYHLQPLQGHLLNCWKATPYSTMNDTWMDDMSDWTLPEGWVWNSGDYKAATDNLNGNASRAAELRILKNLDLVGLITHLTDAKIHYSEKDLEGLDTSETPLVTDGKKVYVLQKNGQLMGHPLSFPILCFLNLAGLKTALRRGRDKGLVTPIEEILILQRTKINGDDILFPCPVEFCKIWEDTTAELGLKLSIGKSYASSYFAVINSRQFLQTSKGLRRIEYVNFGLITNYNLKKEDSDRTPFEIGHCFNEMFEHCPMSRGFLSDGMKSRSKGLPVTGYIPNFFVPAYYGGYGVDRKWSTKTEIFVSVMQRQVAALCQEDTLNSYLISNGISLKGPEMKFLRKLPKAFPLSSSRAGNDMTKIVQTEKSRLHLRVKMTRKVTIDWVSCNRSYGTWVGLLNASSFARDPLWKKSYVQRELMPDRLRKVCPMKVEKIFNPESFKMTYPQNLPEPETALLIYDHPKSPDFTQYPCTNIRVHATGRSLGAAGFHQWKRDVEDITEWKYC